MSPEAIGPTNAFLRFQFTFSVIFFTRQPRGTSEKHKPHHIAVLLKASPSRVPGKAVAATWQAVRGSRLPPGQSPFAHFLFHKRHATCGSQAAHAASRRALHAALRFQQLLPHFGT